MEMTFTPVSGNTQGRIETVLTSANKHFTKHIKTYQNTQMASTLKAVYAELTPLLIAGASRTYVPADSPRWEKQRPSRIADLLGHDRGAALASACSTRRCRPPVCVGCRYLHRMCVAIWCRHRWGRLLATREE